MIRLTEKLRPCASLFGMKARMAGLGKRGQHIGGEGGGGALKPPAMAGGALFAAPSRRTQDGPQREERRE